jgi:hypothetical protein
MNNTSKTDWARIDAMSDDEIDTSDIPPITDEFFSNAKLRMPTSTLSTNRPKNFLQLSVKPAIIEADVARSCNEDLY